MPFDWPEGKSFAFTIVDDTDHATLANVGPLYRLMRDIGLRTTKTIWVFPSPEDPRWSDGVSLEDADYRNFLLELQRDGFEIALHGVRGTSSERPVIEAGLKWFEEVFGRPPRMHVNHSKNLDNLYWGSARVPAWRRALRLHGELAPPTFGHDERSPYFWGDLCNRHITYVRSRSFSDINTLKCDPFMPYHERRYPLVRRWYSCSDGGDLRSFKRVLSRENQERLAAEGGVCVLYAHLGAPGFVSPTGVIDAEVADQLTMLAGRNGWFRPATEILDYMAGGNERTLRPWQAAQLWLRSRRDRGSQAG